jgi:hypothetical protein
MLRNNTTQSFWHELCSCSHYPEASTCVKKKPVERKTNSGSWGCGKAIITALHYFYKLKHKRMPYSHIQILIVECLFQLI